jgi:hypothetical protein
MTLEGTLAEDGLEGGSEGGGGLGQNWPLPHFLLVWLVPKLNADAPLYAEPQVASAYPARV